MFCKPYSKETTPIFIVVTNCLPCLCGIQIILSNNFFSYKVVSSRNNIGKNKAQTLNFTYVSRYEMSHFVTSYMKQNKHSEYTL